MTDLTIFLIMLSVIGAGIAVNLVVLVLMIKARQK